MKFVVEKHPNPEYVTIHITKELDSDNLKRDILYTSGIVSATYEDVYKIKLKVGLAFDIDELLENVQDKITTHYNYTEENLR